MMIWNFTDGWRKKIVRDRLVSALTIFLISLGFVLITAHAGAQGEDEITSADIALLEFLGDWGTSEGEWIDPLLFDDEAAGEKQAVSDETMSKAPGENNVWKDGAVKRENKKSPFDAGEHDD